jgi:hypothetical protein
MDQVVRQLPGVVASFRGRIDEARAGAALAQKLLGTWREDFEGTNARIEAAMAESAAPFALAHTEWPDAMHDAPRARNGVVIAADGSSIEPDRFAPVQCYVINTGWVVLPYGVDAACELASRADVGPLEPGERDRGSRERVAAGLRGVRLRRDVGELERAAELAAPMAGTYTVTVLLDGTLLPWDLQSPQVPEQLRRELATRVSAALSCLRGAADRGPFAVGAYISASNSSDVVASLGTLGSGAGTAPGDRGVFGGLLRDGQRSAVFRARTNRVHPVEEVSTELCFFYVRSGDDVARVEMPLWMADDPDRLALLHATLVDQ